MIDLTAAAREELSLRNSTQVVPTTAMQYCTASCDHLLDRMQPTPLAGTTTKVLVRTSTFEAHALWQDEELVRSWAGDLTAAAREAGARPQALLVFLNPFGGQASAREIWARKALPVFHLAGAACSWSRSDW